MAACRTMKALALFATIAAVEFLGGAQAACTSEGDICTPEQVDVDSGCSATDDVGSCFSVAGWSLICRVSSTDNNFQACGDGCGCFDGMCADFSLPSLICGNTFSIEPPGTGGDPHMIGLQGQEIDWKGEDGGWYALLCSDDDGVQISLRLTAPLPAHFPERQLITGFALKESDGSSLVIKTKNPYTTITNGCPREDNKPCLSEGALEITVDGEDREAVSFDNVILPGGTVMTATNLPTECQPYGGDVIWARKFTELAEKRHLENAADIDEWVLGWSTTTAAPSWCAKYIADYGVEGLFDYRSKHAVFRIETPSFILRLHHGTNHQGGERLEDGRILPDLEFWQMDVHFEWLDLNADTVTGILGETMRPVIDSAGHPIMSGIEALRGKVEDFRVTGPLESDFAGFHE